MSVDAVSPEKFREAWSCFCTGVTIITTPESETPGAETRIHGMTANGIVSVSLEPPLALVSVGHNRNSYPLIKHNRRFAISILNTEQSSVALHYTRPPAERGSDRGIEFMELGQSMAIAGAIAAMDCQVVAEYDEGDHTLFVGRVEYVRIGEGEPMLWYRGSFGRFSAD